MTESTGPVLWATDGSTGAAAALEAARALGVLADTQIMALLVDHRLDFAAAGWRGRGREDPRERLRREVHELADDGLDIELAVVHTHREAADVVAAEAVERRATLIVCGTRGLGALPGVFLGSFTQRLLHLAPCPVLAVRAPDAVTAGDEPAELHTQV